MPLFTPPTAYQKTITELQSHENEAFGLFQLAAKSHY
jgi:hypothetical protein